MNLVRSNGRAAGDPFSCRLGRNSERRQNIKEEREMSLANFSSDRSSLYIPTQQWEGDYCHTVAKGWGGDLKRDSPFYCRRMLHPHPPTSWYSDSLEKWAAHLTDRTIEEMPKSERAAVFQAQKWLTDTCKCCFCAFLPSFSESFLSVCDCDYCRQYCRVQYTSMLPWHKFVVLFWGSQRGRES